MTTPHKRIRISCKLCPMPSGTKHNEDSHRFHGKGSYVRTHCNTPYSRTYGLQADYCRRNAGRVTRNKASGRASEVHN